MKNSQRNILSLIILLYSGCDKRFPPRDPAGFNEFNFLLGFPFRNLLKQYELQWGVHKAIPNFTLVVPYVFCWCVGVRGPEPVPDLQNRDPVGTRTREILYPRNFVK